MVKERTDQRFYDNDGYKKRSACVCVKNENENEVYFKLYWLLKINKKLL
jgi:hypothetical protein